MKILDAGTKVLSDHEVLSFIQAKRKEHKEEDAKAKANGQSVFPRPDNFLLALQRHEYHLNHTRRPFLENPSYKADESHIIQLMEALEPRVQLTKTELLMLVNQRPHNREMMLPMIEDVESRYSEEDQNFIVEKVVEVLGAARPVTPDPDQMEEGE
ncbi:putative RNA polymerase Rpb4 [Elsinoe australis]|uniref:DNA-directed RNA polymerase III subunit RPC9 n=1 Tax=Elsinoe australis TaxID=40998 RepID=A0A4U7AVV1_9PEZI|nr:putative RNA polymerase Rpb4 [Elsinoe australis]